MYISETASVHLGLSQVVDHTIFWMKPKREKFYPMNSFWKAWKFFTQPRIAKKIQFTKGGADRQLNLWIYPPPRPWRDWPPSHCPAFALFPRSYSLTIFIISKLLFLLIYHVQRVLEDVHHLTWYKLFRYWTRALLCSSNEMCSGKKKRGTHKWRI